LQKVIVLLFFFSIILMGCNAKITEDDLIGGYWSVTSGYKDGKPYCKDFLSGGLEFKDKETVYGEEFNEDFKYKLEKRKHGLAIEFIRKDIHYSYYIDKINKDEIGLIGVEGFQEDQSCYLKRND